MRGLLILLMICAQPVLAGPAIIGHLGMKPIDRITLQRIYTGKVVEINGKRVTPINLPPGNRLRDTFLETYLDQDDAKYIGYWTVRRYVGKGAPPRELESAEAVLRYVAEHQGAIGYVDEADVTPDVSVLHTLP